MTNTRMERMSVVLLLCAMAAIASPAQTFNTLLSFDGSDGEGPASFASLVQGLDGNLYGTTLGGGANGNGTVFKITPAGTLTTLYSFCAQTNCIDGASPEATLVLATNGNFYGTTLLGGSSSNCGGGCGTVFKITPAGTLTTLYSFCAQTNCPDDAFPVGLVLATNGNFYGTTGGFSGNCSSGGCGTVFKITPSGTLTTLHRFDGTDGDEPPAGLVQGTDGNFYGITRAGGANGDGTVFKITLSGTLTTLHSFDVTDGDSPDAILLQGTDGNLYGTTFFGGSSNCSNGCGTVFKITPSGTFTTQHSFDGTDGSNSASGLVQATNGAFYGATSSGGSSSNCSGGCGTIFSLSMGLAPFVETLPTSGKVETTVKILGKNLRGVTGVSFNGTAATFTVVSNSYIKTSVPKGATTGFVTVATPSRTLKSNKKFRVIP